MKAIIDADILTYQIAALSERRIDWGDGEESVALSSHTDVHEQLRFRIDEISKTLAVPTHAMLFAFSCPTKKYFRHTLWPEYKAHRKGRPPLVNLPETRRYVFENFNCMSIDNLEADDVIGIMADTYGNNAVVVSSDKDLNQIPGPHINPSRLEDGMYTVTEHEAERWHMMQTLMGDSTDNYPGCPGIGKVKAGKIIESGWRGVLEAFKLKGYSKKYAIVQARVAKILRAKDYNHKRKKVKAWKPVL